MALEEPSVSEVIRSIDSRTIRIEQSLNTFVTKELHDRDIAELRQDISELKNKRQQWWTLLALPLMVGVLVVILQEVIK